MEKEQPKWKRIAKGDRLPCWSFVRKMDGTVLPLTTIGGAFSGQDAYYLPVKDVIEIIKDFPKEESKDERIRKWLICTLKSLNNSPVQIDGAYEMMLPAIAWLEKQGEQKPANSIWHEMTENPEGDENDRTLVVFEDGYSTTSNALLHIGFGTSKSYKWAYVNDILRLTSNTKQSEQKPAEWSEEDKKLIDDTCHLINTLASGYGEKVTEPITFSGTQMIASIKDRLRALVDNRPQNAWRPSDEQIRVVARLRHCLLEDVRGNDVVILDNLLEQLKAL